MLGDDLDYAGYDYPPPKFEFSQITNEQIHRVISKLGPSQSPWPDGTSNALLIQCAELVVPTWGRLQATFGLGAYPSQ